MVSVSPRRITVARRPGRGRLACRAATLLSILLFIWSDPVQASAEFLWMWGESGSGPGRFSAPFGITVTPDGYVYVAGYSNNDIQKFTAQGEFVLAWGTEGSDPGQFFLPVDVDVDAEGQVYVADAWNQRIQKFSSDGMYLDEWPGPPTPIGVAPDEAGHVYVVSYDAHKIVKYTDDGVPLLEWGSPGNGPGEFQHPMDAMVGPDGLLYVSDTFNDRIQVFDSEGTFVRSWGEPGSAEGQLRLPNRLGFDSAGRVYVADNANDRMQVFDPDGGFLYAWGETGDDPDQFEWPSGVAVDGQARVFVTDRQLNRVQVFQAGIPSSVPLGGVSSEMLVFPNPASSQVRIRLAELERGPLSVEVLDVTGRSIRELVPAASSRVVEWDGRDGFGVPAPAGVYFLRVLHARGDDSRSTRVVWRP